MTSKFCRDEMTPAQERILAVLRRQPNMAAADIAAQAFVGMSTLVCGGYIRVLKNRVFIHVSGWRKIKGRFSTPLYSIGNKPDVVRPLVDETNREAPGMERIVSVLANMGGLTYREIAKFSGLSSNTLKNSGYLRALLAQGRIHVGQWRRSRNGPMSPVYVAGPGVDAAKPPALTPGEKNRRHRCRHAKNANRNELSMQIHVLLGSSPRELHDENTSVG